MNLLLCFFIISWQQKRVVSKKKKKKRIKVYSIMLSLFKEVMKVLHSQFMSAIKHNMPLIEMIKGWGAGLLRTNTLHNIIIMLPQPIILVMWLCVHKKEANGAAETCHPQCAHTCTTCNDSSEIFEAFEASYATQLVD